MRRYVTLLILLFSVNFILAYGNGTGKKKKYPGGKCYMYRIMLTDKNGTPYTTACPEDFLSERAITRRQRQHIDIDSTDLPLSPVYLKKIEASGIKIVSKSKWNNTVLVRGNDKTQLENLANSDFVKNIKLVWTSPDSIRLASRREKIRNYTQPSDTVYKTPYGATFEQINMLGGTYMHENGFTGQGFMIAVMDGGFMNADVIPALKNINITGTKDFVVPCSQDIFSTMGHGTMVLSAMAVNMPYTFMGTAPGASYLLLRCEDELTESLAEEDYWAAAAEYADSMGVDIINSSLGFHHFDDASTNYKYSDLDGRKAMISNTASMLATKGIVLVNSAGNDGMETWKKINFPADAHNILTVGAVCENGVNATFSSVGPTADNRIKPDVMAQGSPTVVITSRGTINKDIGTSFSTPLVTGMVACLWQALPYKTATEIIELVRCSGNNNKTPDNILGYGIPNFKEAYIKGVKEVTGGKKE